MKNKLYWIAIAAIMFAGCSDDDAEWTDKTLQPEPAVTVSEHVVVIDDPASVKVIAVSATGENWVVDNSEVKWLSAEQQDQSLLLSVATTFPPYEPGNIYVNLVDESGNILASDSFYVVNTWTEDTYRDLSETETANCYIAPTRGSYRFNAVVRGNGNGDYDGGARYIQTYGVEITDGVYADLLWESTFDADKTRSSNIIEGAPIYKNGHIYFKTGFGEGNACIALKTADGTIRWSWHIWVTDNEIVEVEGNNRIWMDRNLGALNNTPQDISNLGLLYQWGRKDPFLSASDCYPPAPTSMYDDNLQTGEGSGEWVLRSYQAKEYEKPPGNLLYAIEHPMTHIISFGDVFTTFWDWCLVVTDINVQFWGDENNFAKTIFDPCPAGWVVPGGEDFYTGEFMPWIRAEDEDGTFLNGFTWDINGEFFPANGIRTHETGRLLYAGEYLHLWTRSTLAVDKAARIRILHNSTPTDDCIDTATGWRGYAQGIRCVKE